jgi:hypothetical protein
LLIGNGCSTSRGWAAVYKLYGLEVNADKTWVSGTSCDFLHEVYHGCTVRAFPARVGRSMIWKKPVMGAESGGISNVGVRLTEKMSDALKGVRRGLEGARDFAWRSLLRFGAKHGVSEAKLRDVFETPSYLGGFGFGNQGRSSLSVTGGEVDTANYRVTSGVHPSLHNTFYKNKGRLTARLGLSVFMRTTKVVVSVLRVHPPSRSPRTGSIPQDQPLRTAWSVHDGVSWQCSLSLESWKARERSDGRVRWLPDDRLRCQGARKGLRILLRYEAFVKRFKLDIAATTSTAESWIYVLDVLHRMWLGACSFFAWRGADFGKSVNMRSVENDLRSAVHSYVYTCVPKFWVRV